jgi:hypothetical protein
VLNFSIECNDCGKNGSVIIENVIEPLTLPQTLESARDFLVLNDE